MLAAPLDACGAPLAPGGQEVTRDSVSPFEPAEIDIGGYALVSADSLDCPLPPLMAGRGSGLVRSAGRAT